MDHNFDPTSPTATTGEYYFEEPTAASNKTSSKQIASAHETEATRIALLQQHLPHTPTIWRRLVYANGSSYEGEVRLCNRKILPKTNRFQKLDVYDTSMQHPLENIQVVAQCFNNFDLKLERDVKIFSFILHGNGRYVFSNGDAFEGAFVCNRMHGTGLHTTQLSSTTVQGHWSLGQLECASHKVLLNYGNGDVYDGWLEVGSGLFRK